MTITTYFGLVVMEILFSGQAAILAIRNNRYVSFGWHVCLCTQVHKLVRMFSLHDVCMHVHILHGAKWPY